MLVLAPRPAEVAKPIEEFEPSATGQYVRNLLTQHLGYPLLVPEPPDNDPDECKHSGINIGDVGKLTSDGSFVRFFNIYESVDGPSQCCALPDGFKPLEVMGDVVLDEHRYGKNSVIVTKGPGHDLEGFAEFREGQQKFFWYKPTASDGAIIFLPDGAASQDLKDPAVLLPYIQKYALDWCKIIAPKPLYLVTGRTMTTGLWANACFSSPDNAPVRQGQPDIQISCAFSAWEDGGQRCCRCSWETSRGATFRYGPGQFDPAETRNQCVVVRGYAISGREPIGRNSALPEGFVLLDGAEGDEVFVDENGDGWEDAIVIESIGEWPAPYHPSKDINDRLLDAYPEARLAIAHDDVWCSVVEAGDITFPNDRELGRRIDVKYEATSESGCVFLTPRKQQATEFDLHAL